MAKEYLPREKVKWCNLEKYPNIDCFLHCLLLTEPPMCTLAQLSDGTYIYMDVELFHELLDLKIDMQTKGG